MPFDPRKSTLYILNQLDATDNTLDPVMDKIFSKYPEAQRRDKALLFAITYGVLRWRKRLDWVIKAYSKTKINKIDPKIRNILRIGLFQVMYLDRIPVSAAVNTAVEMAKAGNAPWVVAYVNGVLRNAAKGYTSVPLPDQTDTCKFLATSHSFPEWLVKRWLNRFGFDETENLCTALNSEPDITLRTNVLKTNKKDLLKALSKTCGQVEETRYSPDGILINSPQIPISEMEPYMEGGFAVQDEAAQAVGYLLNPKPGETVLDACCGLGGKTGHLAQLMKNKGRLVAVDKNDKKLSALKDEMHRMGITIAAPMNHDFLQKNKKTNFPHFDKILLDAPCSGLGVIRRNPDTKWRMKPERIKPLGKRQQTLLNQCADILKPGGVMVYVVCSMEPEENERVIHSFLGGNKEFSVEKPNLLWPDWISGLVDKDGFLRTLPHKHQMDGFFAVRLKKRD